MIQLEITILKGQRVNRDFDSYKALIIASFPKSWRVHNVEVCRTVGSDPAWSDKMLEFCLEYKGEIFASIKIWRRRLRACQEDIIEVAAVAYQPGYSASSVFDKVDSLRAEQAAQAERSKAIYDFVMKEFDVDAWTARQYISEAWSYMPKSYLPKEKAKK